MMTMRRCAAVVSVRAIASDSARSSYDQETVILSGLLTTFCSPRFILPEVDNAHEQVREENYEAAATFVRNARRHIED